LNGTFDKTDITMIPVNIFDKQPNVESFAATFRNCKNVKEIPDKLFEGQRNKGKSISFASTFTGLDKVKEIPKELFDYLKINDFTETFASTGITEYTIEHLINTNLSELTKVDSMFRNCGQLNKIEGNLFHNSPNLKSAVLLFANDEKLIKVEDEIFSDCPALEDVSGMFYGDKNLEKVTKNLFRYDSNGQTGYCKIKYVTYIEYYYSGYVSHVSSDVNTNMPKKVSNLKKIYHFGIFGNCEKLEECPEIWDTRYYENIVLSRGEFVDENTGKLFEDANGKKSYYYVNDCAFYGTSDNFKNRIPENLRIKTWFEILDWKKEG